MKKNLIVKTIVQLFKGFKNWLEAGGFSTLTSNML
jgi:hypothetical protein